MANIFVVRSGYFSSYSNYSLVYFAVNPRKLFTQAKPARPSHRINAGNCMTGAAWDGMGWSSASTNPPFGMVNFPQCSR